MFAIALGWPADGTLHITSLRDRTYVATGGIRDVKLFGCDQALSWTQDGQGMHIELPPEKPHGHAYAFEILVDGELEI